MILYILQLFFSFLVYFILSSSFSTISNSSDNIFSSIEKIVFLFFFLILITVLLQFLLSAPRKDNRTKYIIWIKNYKFKKHNLPLFVFIILFHTLGTFLFSDTHYRGIEGRYLTLSFLFLLFAAFWEEIIFRGFFFKKLFLSKILKNRTKKRSTAVFLIIFQALIFSLAHLKNPDIDILKFFNIFSGGFFLGFIAIKNFKGAFLFHFIWNFAQAAVLGLPISGQKLAKPIFYANTSKNWEDNIITGIIFLTASVFLYRNTIAKRRTLINAV
ncbi:MAG: CPBP family intramembrane metalloprotease [Spirochaetia bacterium]|nr:CPBP family intramembrane metalloprotease [Spirochaetia bacterium]